MIRQRDYVILKDLRICSVVACGANGVKCLVRYAPDERGDRVRKGIPYRKVPREEAEFLEVPEWEISEVLRALHATKNVKDPLVMEILSKFSDIMDHVGITGSYLCGLNLPDSDIDFVVYGDKFNEARRIIRTEFQEPSIEKLREIYDKRRPSIGFDEFILHERRKWNKGMFGGRKFDILYVRDRNSAPQDEWRGEKVGVERICCKVVGVDEPFGIPTVYYVDHPSIRCVMNYLHDYVFQCEAGEIMEARGVVEMRGSEERLIVGSTPSGKGEWIKSLTLLGEV